jgi:hypothetical protein
VNSDAIVPAFSTQSIIQSIKALAGASLRNRLCAVTTQGYVCPGVPCATRLSLERPNAQMIDDASKPVPKISDGPVRSVPSPTI